MTDNGPQYTGKAFREFTSTWDIQHTTSSPHYARSNGFIERHVKHVKTIITKCLKEKEDIQVAMLYLRATPNDAKLPSPAEILLSRPLTTLLPSRHEPTSKHYQEHMEERKEKITKHHNATSRDRPLPPLSPGEQVRILNRNTKTWTPGTIKHQCRQPRSYIVETPNGATLRRNRSHLRPITLLSTTKTHSKDIHPPENIPSETQTEGEKQEHSPKTTHATTTRSGRVIKKPGRYSDE